MNIIKKSVGLFGYELINKKHQPSLMPHLLNLIGRNSIDLVIDAGANRGQFAAHLRRSGYAGEIHSFEPVSHVFAQLEKASAADARWHAHRLALGDEDGQQVINVSDQTGLSSFLSANDFGEKRFQEIKVLENQQVDVCTLDTFFTDVVPDAANRRTLLKMDTQGYDLKVFGGSSAFRDNIICILSELSFKPIYSEMPTYLETLKVYEEAGYGVTGFFPVTRSRDLTVIELDCVMLKRSLPAEKPA